VYKEEDRIIVEYDLYWKKKRERDSILMASLSKRLEYEKIRECCKGIRPTTGMSHWRYKDSKVKKSDSWDKLKWNK
jgi:hypothetical protein